MSLNMFQITTLLILMINFFGFLPFAHPLSFNLTHFDPSSSNQVLLEGDAKISSGSIELTTNASYRVGRIVASEPLQLWDSSRGTLTDFTSRFSFTYDIGDANKTDDGLSFFIAPFGYPIPPNSAGEFFGILNHSTAVDDTSRNHILMVEFDSFSNSWDPSSHHVGININSIASVATADCDFISHKGKQVRVTISYNGNSKNLSVMWAYENYPVHLTNSSLFHIVDLKLYLPELVSVGISASTGFRHQGHVVNSWEFSSNLDIKKSKKKAINKKLLVVVVLACSLMSLVGISIYLLLIRRKSRREILVSINTDLERQALPRKFSYQELVAATNGFADDRRHGRGGSGQVFKGTLNDLDRAVAVKRIFGESEQSERIFTNEVKIISRLIHRSLVQFIGWCHEQNELLLVFEYMPNGSLDAHLFGDRRTLPWEVRYKIALGLASAINYLHEEAEQCVLHRDIKSANVLLDTDFSTKLGDFGVAKLVDPRLRTQMTGLVGTLGYLAPEYVNGGRASKESDMYSFGVVALEIACGKRTFQDGEYHVQLMRRVWDLYVEGNILEAADERLEMKFDKIEMERLLMVGLWCTHPNDKERPKVGQVIKALLLESPSPELRNDMNYPAINLLSPQKTVYDSLLPPMTSSITNAGR